MKASVHIRDPLIDRLKGFAIILVATGHLIQMQVDPQGFDANILFRVIYSFHMALFFFLSGIVFRLRPTREEVLLSAKRLLIPFLVFFFIVSCNLDAQKFIANLGRYLLNPQMGFWFLFVLAVIRVFCAIALNQNSSSATVLVSLLLLATGLLTIKYLSMHYVLFYLPFFLGGYCFHQLDFKTNRILSYLSKHDVGVILFCVLVIADMSILPYAHRNVDGLSMSGFLLQKTLLAALGTAISYKLFSMIKLRHINKPLELAGRHSLFIYGLHLLFLPLYSYIGAYCLVPMVAIPILIEKLYQRCASIVFGRPSL